MIFEVIVVAQRSTFNIHRSVHLFVSKSHVSCRIVHKRNVLYIFLSPPAPSTPMATPSLPAFIGRSPVTILLDPSSERSRISLV